MIVNLAMEYGLYALGRAETERSGVASRAAVRHRTVPSPQRHAGPGTPPPRPPQSDPSARRSFKARAERLRSEDIEFVDHPAYRHEGLELPAELQAALDSRFRADFTPTATQPAAHPVDDGRLAAVPLLSKHEETLFFCRMNYVKYRASRCRSQLDRRSPSPWLVEEVERLLSEGLAIRNHLVRANLRLVVFVAKDFVDRHKRLSELQSDGTLALIRAVEKFDFARGNRFSTYATRAIRNMFVRAHQSGRRHRQRHLTGYQEDLERTFGEAADAGIPEWTARRKLAYLDALLEHLDERERTVVTGRFALTVNGKKRTLAEIGEALGISKERVRQIGDRALEKLRDFARDRPPEFVDV